MLGLRIGKGEKVLESAKVLILVKAYPTVSTRVGEVDCVAGARLDHGEPEWTRLYPVPFRHLPSVSKFKKYDIINLRVQRSRSDSRPETFVPDCESINLERSVDTRNGWRHRRRLVEPLVSESMCELQRRQKANRTSLGAFRPEEIISLDFEVQPGEWEPDKLAALEVMERKRSQPSIFGRQAIAVQRLKPAPYSFKLKYRCADRQCPTHTQSIIDWEIVEAYRDWRMGRSESETLAAIHAKWMGELCGPEKDTVFFVGNMKARPQNFLVLGIFWPPKLQVNQLELPAFGSNLR